FVPRARGADWTGTAEIAELGPVHLRGEADFAAGSARFVVALRDLRLGPAQRQRLQELLGSDLGGIDAETRVRELTLHVTLPGKSAADRTPIVELAAGLDGLRLSVPDLPPLVQHANADLHVSTQDGG